MLDIFANALEVDICLDGLREEMICAGSIREANFGEKSLSPLQLLNKINIFKSKLMRFFTMSALPLEFYRIFAHCP